MTEPAKRLTPAQRAYLFACRRARRRHRAELREMEDRSDDRLSELQDGYEAGSGRHAAINQDD
jgi:hypothetical protein